MTNALGFVADFDRVLRATEELLGVAQCSGLQRQAIERLNSMRQDVSLKKELAIGDAAEDRANQLLGYECVTEALMAELWMWIFLKEEKPEAAWEKLVVAQETVRAALRAHKAFDHFVQHYRRLEAVEKDVFSDQVFLSPCYTVESLECSICGKDYEDCEHTEGRPYMGIFCRPICRGLEPDHLAIVGSPKDKRSRIAYRGT